VAIQSGKSEIEVMLVTSRGSRRWIIPKGWPKRGILPHDTAAKEAFEEAGVHTIMGTISKHVEIPTPPPGSPGLFRCATPGFMEAAFRKGGLKDIAVKHVVGELKFESAEEYWGFMTEIAAPVVAGLAKADEPTRKRIEAAVLDLARKTSPDGKPCLAWSASTISARR
jgi:8-oxo-dGTP pyrophosphatase MutT (NUDIX family)